jgi:hypothetical protein
MPQIAMERKRPALVEDEPIRVTVVSIRSRPKPDIVSPLVALLRRRARSWSDLRAALGVTPEQLGRALDDVAKECGIVIAGK